ncbi:MAG: hypothetical protein M3O30_12585 [Planctomycetota bacterium]|nr:hypothetical protein [Planctomycetota bacterium]
MNSFLITIVDLLARYLHIVCATTLVGGTLFYEMVVPIAINDLREEQQLLVFARARWVFKWIVWVSAVLILLSGVLSTYKHWKNYTDESYYALQPGVNSNSTLEARQEVSAAGRAGWWWVAHASTGVMAVIIALSLTIGKAPPSQPIRWMRLNLVLLLLVMFLATATRHTRLQAEERRLSPPNDSNADVHERG